MASIDAPVVQRSLEATVIGRADGTFDCDATSCEGARRYTVDIGERVPAIVYAAAPRHRERDYSIKLVYCEACAEAAQSGPWSEAVNEIVASVTLTRDARDEPPYVSDVEILTTSPTGSGVH